MDKYHIVREIGAGSFGKVYVVELRGIGIQYVAKQIDLKMLNKKQKSLAEKEIQVLSKLKHINIVGYKEAYSNEDHLHIVMELCEKGDLHNLIEEKRANNQLFSEAEVMEYFVQICMALEYIHRQRILHRDVKSKNIFLTKRNIIKLGDFGVAKVLEDSFELAQTCIGSPFYISPEICENQPYDKKSDIWALGCVLYELATLKYAFTAKNMKSLLTKISAGDCNPLPSTCNTKMRVLIMKLLRPNPKERPTSSDILAMPFVDEYNKQLSCKPRAVVFVGRSKSGDDLRKKIPFRYKSPRSILPISKSCLNLNSNTNGITDPETKYKVGNMQKTKQRQSVPKMPQRKCEKQTAPAIMNNELKGLDSKKLNLEGPKLRKLPKTDSLYYSMIEEHSKAQNERPKVMAMIKNVLKESIPQEEVVVSKKVFENNSEECEEGHSPNVDESKEKDESNLRKKWKISTADKDELVSFLNEVDLMDTESDITGNTMICKVRNQPVREISIDDMLSMGTTDLSHIALLEPEVISSMPQKRDKLTKNRKGGEILVTKDENKMDGESLDKLMAIDTSTKTIRIVHKYPADEETQATGCKTLLGTHGDKNIQGDKWQTLGEGTFVVSPRCDVVETESVTESNQLEQRRIELENILGLEKFLELYRKLEEKFYRDHKVDNMGHNGTDTYTVIDTDLKDYGPNKKEWVAKVWKLVIDDYMFSQQC